MSRKPSFDHDLTMSARYNYSDKGYLDLYSSKKYAGNFDKFSSQVLDRNASQ